jgi:hypothetical protein
LTVTEVDGAPSGRPITTIKVSNGDLTISGNVATIDTSGSGGTPGGSDGQVQYNNAGAFGGDSDFKFDGTTVTIENPCYINGDINSVVAGGSDFTITARDSTGGTIQGSISMGGGTDEPLTLTAGEAGSDADIVLAPGSGAGKTTTQSPIDSTTTIDADVVRIGDGTDGNEITTNTAEDLVLNTNTGTNSGSLTIQEGADNNIQITPNGSGKVQISGSYTLPTGAGTDTYVMTSDGAGAASWAAAGGGGVERGYRTGYYYNPLMTQSNNVGSFSCTADKTYTTGIYISESTDFDRLVMTLNSGTASASGKYGIYSLASDGLPSTLLVDGGTFDASSSGNKESTISPTLDAGYYIFAFVFDDAVSVRRMNNDGASWFLPSGTTLPAFPKGMGYLRFDQSFSTGLGSLSGVAPDEYGEHAIPCLLRAA